ncbi:MAG: HAMP domain-containing protein [Lachnospiraceae bacterium]|nr:HAMP domain-containing protein [Lachnospiraceae bacterium]
MALKGKKKISGIFLRLFGYYLVLLLLFTLILGVTFMNMYSNSNIEYRSEELERVGKIAADSIREFILDNDYEGALSYLEVFNEIQSGEIWILSNPDANRPLNKRLETVKTETVNSQSEFAELLELALSGKKKTNSFFSNIHYATAISAGIPIYGRGNEVCGALIITEALTDLDEIKSTGVNMIFLSATGAMIVAVAVSVLFASQITRPLMKVRGVTKALQNGDYTAKTGLVTNDELGEMAKSIDMLADRLYQNQKEADNIEQMRQDFFANVSHELRTPIAVVRAYTESMVDGVVTDPEKVEQYNKRILAECKSMERLVGDLLTLSKMQNPDFKIDAEPVNLVHIFEEIVRSALAISAERGIQIAMHRESNVYMIMGDYDRLRQMFIVILDNAIKFSNPGKTIHLNLRSEKRKVICSIKDEGIGISEEELPNIFEKFYKSKLRQNAKGTGLGLPIAKQIALKHGGTIDVKSKVGKGTEFIFTFDEIFEEDL